MKLIKDLEELKKYMPVDQNTSMDTIESSVTDAEDRYLMPALGDTVFNNLADGVEADDLTADEEALLEYCLKALAPLAYYIGLPELNVRMGDNGLHTAASSDVERLPKWMFDNLQIALCKRGFAALDRLYLYLEKGDGKDWYDDWKDSDAYSNYKDLLLNSAATLNEYVEAGFSRWFFMQLITWIKATERQMLVDTLGPAFFDELKEAFAEDDTDEYQDKLITYLQECISYMAYSKALSDPVFVQNLIVVNSTNRDQVEDQRSRIDDFKQQAQEYENLAQAALNRAINYLNKNASETIFTTWFESDLYKAVDGSEGSFDERNNNQTSNGTFFF